jgi:hypothetical protein
VTKGRNGESGAADFILRRGKRLHKLPEEIKMREPGAVDRFGARIADSIRQSQGQWRGQGYAGKRVAWHLGNTRPAGQLTGAPVALMMGA